LGVLRCHEFDFDDIGGEVGGEQAARAVLAESRLLDASDENGPVEAMPFGEAW